MSPTAPDMTDVELREELPADIGGIRAVNEAAFEDSTEANLVDALRGGGRVAISLVATQGDEIVGHLLVSNAKIVGPEGETPCLALAPMAVLPSLQRRGIGTRLVRQALELARNRGHRIVVVLGHPDYYPRFGFQPAAARGIGCPYDAPPEAFMVCELQSGATDGVRGVVEYSPEFDAA